MAIHKCANGLHRAFMTYNHIYPLECPLFQVTSAFTAPISWDKAPNQYGQKTVGVDPTGVIKESHEGWKTDIASVGCQYITLAIQQGLVTENDLKCIRLGDSITIPDLIRRRRTATAEAEADDAKEMFVP